MPKKPRNLSPPERRETSSESAIRHSDDGQRTEKSTASSRQRGVGSMTLTERELRRQMLSLIAVAIMTKSPFQFCMLASLLQNSEMTSNAKSNSFGKNIQKQKSCPTSVPGSTGTARVSERSWISRIADVSPWLSWRSVIDCAALPSSSSNMSSPSMAPSFESSALRTLLLSKNSKKTSSASFKYSAAEGTENGDTVKGGRQGVKMPEGHVIATRKIRIRPTTHQKHQIDKMAGRFGLHTIFRSAASMRCGARNGNGPKDCSKTTCGTRFVPTSTTTSKNIRTSTARRYDPNKSSRRRKQARFGTDT